MAKIEEHYSIARHTSNLKSSPLTRMSASDILMSTGMAAQRHETALLLWDVAFRGKTSAKLALVDLLAKSVAGHMLRHRLKGNPRTLARAAVAWYLSQCPACGGEGHQIIEGTITRSDELCPDCHGTGKLPKPEGEAFRWLADEMAQLAHSAAGCVRRKLAVDL